MNPPVGANETVRNWTAGTLPSATPTKPANTCKEGDYSILSCFLKLQVWQRS